MGLLAIYCSCTLHVCMCAWELVSHHRLLVFVNISFLFFSFEFYLMTNYSFHCTRLLLICVVVRHMLNLFSLLYLRDFNE